MKDKATLISNIEKSLKLGRLPLPTQWYGAYGHSELTFSDHSPEILGKILSVVNAILESQEGLRFFCDTENQVLNVIIFSSENLEEVL
jgi:hypothetical protein